MQAAGSAALTSQPSPQSPVLSEEELLHVTYVTEASLVWDRVLISVSLVEVEASGDAERLSLIHI